MVDDSAAPVPPPSPGGAGLAPAHSPLPNGPVSGPPTIIREKRLYKKRVGDWLTYSRAEEMAYAIKHYWMDRGYMGVETFVVAQSIGMRGGETLWCVRSNMVNGIPPR